MRGKAFCYLFSRHCEPASAGEAIQKRHRPSYLDCFRASPFAMTKETSELRHFALKRQALILAVLLCLFAGASTAFAAEPQPGDACSLANSFIRSGGVETSGDVFYMTCQGGVWVRVMESDTAGYLGVDQASPKAPLHVGGEAIIGATTGLPCDADREGGLRWSSTAHTIEMCDGTSWQKIVASVPTVNLVLTPASQNSMDVDGSCGTGTCTGTTVDFTLQNQGTLTSASIAVSLTNTTNFTIISDTCTGNTLDLNQTCVVQVQPQATGNTPYTGTLQITANNNPFAVLQGTASGFGCTPGRTGGGGIYAACNQNDGDGAYDLVIMPGGCDGTTTNPTCAGSDGGPVTMVWGPGGASYATICNSDLANSCKGAQEAVDLMQLQAIGYGTFPAASYCDAMSYGGKTDWFLPNPYEMKSLIYPSQPRSAVFLTPTTKRAGKGIPLSISMS